MIEQTAVDNRYSDAVDSNNGNDHENVKSTFFILYKNKLSIYTKFIFLYSKLHYDYLISNGKRWAGPFQE